jgi:hypothetical protein
MGLGAPPLPVGGVPGEGEFSPVGVSLCRIRRFSEEIPERLSVV